MQKKHSLLLAVLIAALAFSGCYQKSYPGDRLKESLGEIAQKEYGISEVDVKIVGKTIGVYLPLDHLFSADFRESLMSGKVNNIENLFIPSEEAMEKIEDVLFSLSRVLLSTDRDLAFYYLQATDIKKTGMQLTLKGYVNDIKRVRIWDISRGEYRKRVINELRFNRPVVWHQPVRRFFKDLETLPVSFIRDKYFDETIGIEAVENLFMNHVMSNAKEEALYKWEITDIRSAPIRKNEVVVFAEVLPQIFQDEDYLAQGSALKYLFIVSASAQEPRLTRVIPFQFVNDSGDAQEIPLPPELQLSDENVHWQREFELEEIRLGPFLAEQLTRRLQALLSVDERIHSTFQDVKLEYRYHEDNLPSYFSLNLEAYLSDPDMQQIGSVVQHEDMIYLLSLAFREFVEVMRSYDFGDYAHLKLNIAHGQHPWVLGRDHLELFRKKKIDFQGLLAVR